MFYHLQNEHGNDDENESVTTSFSMYYIPKVEIKDFNVLNDGKPFFEIPVKNKEEALLANYEANYWNEQKAIY